MWHVSLGVLASSLSTFSFAISLGPHLAPSSESQCDQDTGLTMFKARVAQHSASKSGAYVGRSAKEKRGTQHRIAFALRGEGFRSGSSNSGFHLSEEAYTCGNFSYEVQSGIWKSHMSNVIGTLESLGHAVDTYIFTKPCYNGKEFQHSLKKWYNPKRFILFDSTTFAQKEPRGIYDPDFHGEFNQSAFAEHLLEQIDNSAYDSILMVRLDQMFDVPITDMMEQRADGLHFPQQGEAYFSENMWWFHSDDKGNVHHQIRAGCALKGFGTCQDSAALTAIPKDAPPNVQAYFDGSSIYWRCEIPGAPGSGDESQYFENKGLDGPKARFWILRQSGAECCDAGATVSSFATLIA